MGQKNKIRWAIIGCGDVTEQKSGPAYQKTDGFEIAAVMRRDAAKAADYAKRHGIARHTSDAAALIEDPEIDAIYIATPPDSHKRYALAAAAAGKPCCIEKPMAPRHSDCQEIIDAFAAARQPVFVAYYRRNLPRFLKVKQWLDSGLIGTPRHISWALSKPPSPQDLAGTPNWRTDATVAPGGYFDDLASHGLDLFDFLLSPIATVSGHSANQLGLYSAKDSISASWIHENDVTGTGYWNFGSQQKADAVEILGERGTLRFSIFDDAPVSLESDQQSLSESIPHPENVQEPFVQALADHLLRQVPHSSQAISAARTSWVMDQILS